ncbi:heme-degrading domain-containing protein [Neogemmobacter tilapiae]|uniref:UPF0303 protein n=1 Tax=Neogemmobacter tilapiae TaxID=875041 RepID=A0A918WI07_9RHOB|nr:heme-degrading domain-containing protein [Gemmobacter tilapiae]GHC53315.1 UPF0303 protein [Gemmobacter tilapiae]
MDIATLEAQEERLVFAGFDEAVALRLGQKLVELGLSRAHPIVITIRTPDRTLFHAALPGAKPLNDKWALRKSNTTLLFHEASYLVGSRMREKGGNLAVHGCDSETYSESGGSFPIRVQGTGMIGAVTVSGLPQHDDHALVVEAIGALLFPPA